MGLFSRKVKPQGVIEKSYLDKFLPAAPVILEAGAHTGVDTVEMSKRWSNSAIHAFEPVPDLFSRLSRNTTGFPNISIYPLALGETNGTAKLFISGGSSDGSSSLLPPREHLTEHPSVVFNEVIDVTVTTMDEWADAHDIPRIDFLWLDMQGSELAMMKASPRSLKSVGAIYSEVSLKELYAGSPLYPEVRDWLAGQGFRVEREELAWADAGNVLFVRDRLAA